MVQLEGEKIWDLFRRPSEVPPQYHHRLKLDVSTLESNPLSTIVLRAGEALYLPRGCPHRAKTVDGTSLHVTFSLEPIDFAYVLQEALDMLRHTDELFREQISPDIFLDIEVGPKPETLQRLSQTLLRPDFMARLIQAVHKKTIQDGNLSVAPLFDIGTQQAIVKE